jgi:hypothetical protein
MLHILRFFFSSSCRLFHNATFFGSSNIHIWNTGCAKIKKKIQRQMANEFLVCFRIVQVSETQKAMLQM